MIDEPGAEGMSFLSEGGPDLFHLTNQREMVDTAMVVETDGELGAIDKDQHALIWMVLDKAVTINFLNAGDVAAQGQAPSGDSKFGHGLGPPNMYGINLFRVVVVGADLHFDAGLLPDVEWQALRILGLRLGLAVHGDDPLERVVVDVNI